MRNLLIFAGVLGLCSYGTALQVAQAEEPGSISALAERLPGLYGRLHVLVNNAGILRERGERPSAMPVVRLKSFWK